MSEETTMLRRTPWMGWTLGVLAVPVVYLLTMPPVVFSVMYDKKTNHFNMGPEWLRWYSAPADWLHRNVPGVQEPMDAYLDWWVWVFTGKKAP